MAVDPFANQNKNATSSKKAKKAATPAPAQGISLDDIKIPDGAIVLGENEGMVLIQLVDGNFDMIALDEDKAQEMMDNGGFLVPDEGTYDAYLSDIESTHSKNGNPMVKFVFTLLGKEGKNAKIWDYVVPLAVPSIFLANMHALGRGIGNLAITADLIGTMVEIDVVHGEYNDRVTANKGAVRPHPDYSTLISYNQAKSGL